MEYLLGFFTPDSLVEAIRLQHLLQFQLVQFGFTLHCVKQIKPFEKR